MLISRNKITIYVFLLMAVSSFAYWEWTPQTRRWINPKYAVKDTAEEQFAWAEQFRAKGNIEKAINEHRKLLKHFSESEYAPESCFILGEIFKERGDTKKAFDYFERITNSYPGSPRVLDAVKMKIEIAEKSMETHSFSFFKGKEKEKGDTLAGVLKQYPYIKEADEKSLYLGKFYLEIKEYDRARDVFLQLMEKTLDSSVREEAYFYLIKAEYLSIPSVTADTTGVKTVKDRIESFTVLYPESKYIEEVLDIKNRLVNYEAKKYFEIASYYERAGKSKAAKYYYKIVSDNYPETDYGKISSEKLRSTN